MTQRYWILTLTFLLIMTKGYCQKRFFSDMDNNLSWRDSMDCFVILKLIPNSDYAFITQHNIIVYGKEWRSYKKISKQYDFVTLDLNSQTATKYKIEKIIRTGHKQYEDSDINPKRFIIKKMSFDYKRVLDFLEYIDSLSFYKLDNDSLTNQCGLIDSSGKKKCLQIMDSGDEIIYLKNKAHYHSVRSLCPESYVDSFPKNNGQRRTFIACRNRFKNLIKK